MSGSEWLVDQFEANRNHLRSAAYHILGSHNDADDALQEAWLRVSRADASDIENPRAWLTTVVARVCLNMLQSRKSRREEALNTHIAGPIISLEDEGDPEHEAVLADSVGLAMIVVLETLNPAERLAFVLHDVFGLSFDEVGKVVERSPAAARQLASRARRRVQGAPMPDTDMSRQREVVDAFLVASRGGDFEGLLAVLDPDVLLRADGGRALAHVSRVVRGAATIASQAAMVGKGLEARRVVVNGAPGLVSWDAEGRPFSVMSFIVAGGRITEIEILLDPERIGRLGLDAYRN